MAKLLYYAEDGMVWKRPVETENADGTKSISMGFPVCKMHEAAGDAAANVVAQMLCDAERFRPALEKIANGDGVYGAQAHEYKQIARTALE